MLLDSTRTSSLTDENRTATPGEGARTPGRRNLTEELSPSSATVFGAGVMGEVDEEEDGEQDERLEGGGDAEFIRSVAGSPRADELAARSTQSTQPVQKKAKASAKPGGNDALGRKENMLLQWKQEMIEVAEELAGKFTPLGLQFRPQILLATAMQEAAAKDPLNAVSFDNGLGIMQITPYKGKLDPEVAKAIGWDNNKSVAENKRTSNWRNAKANLRAGAFTMLGKAKAIKRGVPATWEQMEEPQKWRAVLYAYNAGEGSALSALKKGGPNARMISTFTNPKGQRVSHDYTKEIKEKMDYVESHDPFDGEGGGPRQDNAEDADAPEVSEPKQEVAARPLKGSVGRGGQNRKADVGAVQERLSERGVSPGKQDSLIGPKTIGAIETFQESALGFSDGLISPGKNTEKELFGESGKVKASKPAKQPQEDKSDDKAEERDADKEERESPTWAAVSANFNATIPGTTFTWHEALWLPSWKRHVKPSDVTNISMDTLLDNVARQAAALTEVRQALGKAIVVHCWVRPPAYNKQIGGASNSSHLRGMATDFHMPGLTAEQVRQAVKSKKLYPGAGENNVSWVHLDLEHKTWFNP